MTLCPIALAVGCKKCPAFSICPLTKVIGDQSKPQAQAEVRRAASKAGSKAGSKAKK
jgi:hypothetical protein